MIKVNNISKKYGNLLAVDKISFELKPGEIIGFLGANGAGKSTTMKIITGTILPDFGTVSIFDYDMFDNPLEAKSRIGYLSEDNPLPEEMYVREYLEYIANIYKLKYIKETVHSAVENFGLKNEYKKKIQALSKGNRQKLGLAQALIHNPDFLVLDEPINGLDPNQQADIKEIITGLKESKIILFSTHNLHDIPSLATRTIIIDHGKKIVDENTDNIDSIESLFYEISNENSSR